MPHPNQNRAELAHPYVVAPRLEHKQTFLLLHGLGSNGNCFGNDLLNTILPSSGHCLPDIFPRAKFIFPTAKLRRSSAFNRAFVTQWFDIAKLGDSEHKKQAQIDGLIESASFLLPIIKAEIQAVGAGNIFLGGISHGCAMSASLLLVLEFALGAYFGICGWLPYQKDILDIASKTAEEDEDFFDRADDDKALSVVEFIRGLLDVGDRPDDRNSISISTPVLILHGELDEKVVPQRGSDLAETFEALGYNVIWKTYAGLEHGFSEMELEDIVDFIKEKSP